jgi:hypothetical protein
MRGISRTTSFMGSPFWLDANDLQEGKVMLDANHSQEEKVNGEFTRKRVEITTAQAALGLQCGNLELLGGL